MSNTGEKIRTLILTGQNNHDWKMSTPFCWLLLGRTGRFDVTVTTDPSSALEDAAGRSGSARAALTGAGALGEIDLLFMDYNGPDWSDAARANFERAVGGGTGLLVLHAADNAFDGWVEFEKMAALLWRKGTGHGKFHEFPVTIVDKDHPVTCGLADFRITDELYHRLVHLHDAEHHVLATAFSAEESGGTGKDEPVMLTTRYGEGRVFHMVLGHVWSGGMLEAFENESFQKALVRACEWAATGDVTLK